MLKIIYRIFLYLFFSSLLYVVILKFVDPPITATQITRNGYNSSDISMTDIAESAGLSHTADVMLGIIQDDLMRSNMEYWLKLLKIRSE